MNCAAGPAIGSHSPLLRLHCASLRISPGRAGCASWRTSPMRRLKPLCVLGHPEIDKAASGIALFRAGRCRPGSRRCSRRQAAADRARQAGDGLSTSLPSTTRHGVGGVVQLVARRRSAIRPLVSMAPSGPRGKRGRRHCSRSGCRTGRASRPCGRDLVPLQRQVDPMPERGGWGSIARTDPVTPASVHRRVVGLSMRRAPRPSPGRSEQDAPGEHEAGTRICVVEAGRSSARQQPASRRRGR